MSLKGHLAGMSNFCLSIEIKYVLSDYLAEYLSLNREGDGGLSLLISRDKF